jgi:DNA-binding GntR family transcriptional regulator
MVILPFNAFIVTLLRMHCLIAGSTGQLEFGGLGAKIADNLLGTGLHDRNTAEMKSERVDVAEPTGEKRADTAYAELKRGIIEGDLEPGSQWLEEDLANRFGMSRTPVREAAVRLAQEGFLQIVPRRGVRIRELTRRDVREVNEVLEGLELQATERLAARRLPPEALQRLDAAVRGMDAALEREDEPGWARADYDFHRLLIALTGNRHLEAVATGFLDKAHRFRVKTLGMRARPVKSTTSHAATVEAIRRGDVEMAVEIHKLHKRRWARELDDLIERLGLPDGE